MCFFPIPVPSSCSDLYSKGLTAFNCGYCPECLKQRANVWALRSCYESKESPYNMMITLTYDSYKRDDRGRIIGENIPDPNIILSKRHVQLFLKRLRKFAGDCKLKYIVCGEHGSRTNRAHYHCLIFGFCFDDLIPYKKSKRGNQIYKSPKLTELWGHGICTVDSYRINGQVSRYCTKYIAKNTRTEDCFMLFSRGIGEKGLLRDFNGKFYTVEGRRYPIPKQIWNKVIYDRYNFDGFRFDYRYVNREDSRFDDNVFARATFRSYRDLDKQYQDYLAYWSFVANSYSLQRPKLFDRICSLPEEKFHFYKTAALRALRSRERGVYVSPRKPCSVLFVRTQDAFYRSCFGIKYSPYGHLPLLSRLDRANDTKSLFIYRDNPFDNVLFEKNRKFMEKFFPKRLT